MTAPGFAPGISWWQYRTWRS